MADHGHVEYATAQGNDLPEHEAMYDRFLHLTVVLGALIINIVISLAIGGVAGHWLVAVPVLIVSTFVAVIGLATGGRTGSAVMVVLSLIALALTAGGGHQ